MGDEDTVLAVEWEALVGLEGAARVLSFIKPFQQWVLSRAASYTGRPNLILLLKEWQELRRAQEELHALEGAYDGRA